MGWVSGMGATPRALWLTQDVTVTFRYHAGAVTDIHAGHNVAWRRLALAHISGYDGEMEKEAFTCSAKASFDANPFCRSRVPRRSF